MKKYVKKIKNVISQLWVGAVMAITSFAVINRHKKLLFIAAVPPLLALLAGLGLYKVAISNLITTLRSAVILNFVASCIGLIVVNIVYASLVVYFSKTTKKRPWNKIIATCYATRWSRVVKWSFLGAFVGTTLTTIDPLLEKASFLHWGIELINYGWWILTFLMIPLLIDEENTIKEGLAIAVTILRKKLPLIVSATGFLLIIKSFVAWIIGNLSLLVPRLIFQYQIIKVRPTLSALSFAIMFSGMVVAGVISVIMTLAETALAAGVYRACIGKPLRAFKRHSPLGLIVISVATIITLVVIASVASFAFMIIELKIPFFHSPLKM